MLKITPRDTPLLILRGGPMGRAASRALKKAGKTAGRDMGAETRKVVREHKAIRIRVLKKALSTRLPQGPRFPMEWAVEIDGQPVLLADGYQVRQTRRGVSTMVARGQRTVVEGAFLARMQTGHMGAFRRTGDARLPIRELVGSRPVDEMSKPGRTDRVQARGAMVLDERFPALMNMELEKLAAKAKT